MLGCNLLAGAKEKLTRRVSKTDPTLSKTVADTHGRHQS